MILDGDVVIKNGDIQMVTNDERLKQKVLYTLKTNLGEWEYDKEEGIDFSAFLRKSPDDEEIRDNIRAGLLQVDPTFVINTIDIKREGRQLYVEFSATNSSGESVAIGGDDLAID